MKIYSYKPTYFVRLQISKIGESAEYLTLTDTTPEEVEKMCKDIIQAQNISLFETGHRTRIDIREAVGAKNGKSKSISFRGLTPKQTFDLIINHINSLA